MFAASVVSFLDRHSSLGLIAAAVMAPVVTTGVVPFGFVREQPVIIDKGLPRPTPESRPGRLSGTLCRW